MDIHSVLEDISSVKKKLSVEIPAKVASDTFDEIASEFRKHAQLPGFRKGKAPFGLVKRRFQADIREEVIKRLVPESYQQAIQDKDVSPVRSPNVGELNFEEGQPLHYVAEFEITPSFELPEYKGLEARLEAPPDPQQLLEKRLADLQDQNTTFLTVDNRAIDLGDYAIIDLKGRFVSEEGLPLLGMDPVDDENVVLEVGGERTHDSFTRALLGMNVAEERTFQVSYAADYPDRKLAGQRVEFTVHVNDIREKQVPALDDDLARTLGDFESLEDLKEKLLEEISQRSEEARQEEVRNKAVEALVDRTSFEVPGVLIDEVVDNKLRHFALNLASRGVDPARSGLDWPKVRAEFQESAEKEVRAHFLLNAVAEAEGIAVEEDEIRGEIERLSETSGDSSEKVRHYFADPDHRSELEDRLKRKKVIDFLVESAKTEG